MGVCLAEDNFCMDRWKWIAELSDGTSVFQDDHRPGEEEKRAWLRLKQYVYNKNLDIKKLRLEFRGNTIYPAKDNADGYYFIDMLVSECISGQNFDCCTIGHWDKKEDCIFVKIIKVPELIIIDQEDRKTSTDRLGVLIKNAKYR